MNQACVAVAGAGGDGGLTAVTLARMGVGRFSLADPEVFEEENLNRQAGCYYDTLGRNKAEVIAAEILRINPRAKVSVFSEGIRPGNLHKFLREATIVVDETEFSQHHLGVMLARACRRRNLRMVVGLNIGFGCLVTSFLPSGYTLERYLGLDEHQSIDHIARQAVDLWRWVPHLPGYVNVELLKSVEEGGPAPSVAPGVNLCSGVLATEVFNHLARRRQPIEAPSSLWLDALEAQIVRIKDPKAEFARTLTAIQKGTNPSDRPTKAA